MITFPWVGVTANFVKRPPKWFTIKLSSSVLVAKINFCSFHSLFDFGKFQQPEIFNRF